MRYPCERLGDHCRYCGRLIMTGNRFQVCTYPACRRQAYQQDEGYRANRRAIEKRSYQRLKAQREGEEDDT